MPFYGKSLVVIFLLVLSLNKASSRFRHVYQNFKVNSVEHSKKSNAQRKNFCLLASKSASTSLTRSQIEVPPITIFEEVLGVTLDSLGSFCSGGALGYVFGFITKIAKEGLKAAHAGGCKSALDFGAMGAVYAGCEGLARVVRHKEDQYNNLVGAFFTGCYISRTQGNLQMLQGGVSYAGFSYLLARLAPAPSQTKWPVDIPVEDGVSATKKSKKKRAQRK